MEAECAIRKYEAIKTLSYFGISEAPLSSQELLAAAARGAGACLPSTWRCCRLSHFLYLSLQGSLINFSIVYLD